MNSTELKHDMVSNPPMCKLVERLKLTFLEGEKYYEVVESEWAREDFLKEINALQCDYDRPF